jgi:signal transduction histidine kinase
MANVQPETSRPATLRRPSDTSDAGVYPSATPDIDLVERLAAHRTLGSAPRSELEWLAAHGRLSRYEAGDLVSTPSRPITDMYILLSGRLSIYLLRGTVRHKVAEWRGGDVTGLLPYSRLTTPPGETIVEERLETLALPSEALREMARECHEVTSLLVHVMVDRARYFTSTLLHDEKLKSIGKLAAGLAHELNNPAAALARFAKTLPAALTAVESASTGLAWVTLDPAQHELVTRLRDECRSTAVREVQSPFAEAQREEAIAEWLESRGIPGTSAEGVAQSPVSIAALERLAASVPAGALGPAVEWVAADCSIRRLAGEIDQAATRISDLVRAVRGFTRVDASPVPQAVDVAEGLTETLAVLRGKARDRGAGLAVSVEDALPPVRGIAAELNQVWSNLIDNALDAVGRGGHVEVSAKRRGPWIDVQVADDGSGIPADIKERVFDPFFTTKDVGQGTGLGLDIVRRIVAQHDGDIEVTSAPGRTVFTVTLPAVPGEGGRP